jgi:hypothetical protein
MKVVPQPIILVGIFSPTSPIDAFTLMSTALVNADTLLLAVMPSIVGTKPGVVQNADHR